MPIKLIATDLDGTLMSPDHMTITPFTVETLKKAHDKGVKIAIATGRPLSLTDNVTNQIPFADYVIYANGAGVYDRNNKKTICSDVIVNKTAIDIIHCFLKEKIFFEIYIDGKSHFQTDRMEFFVNNSDMPQEFIDEVAGTMSSHDNLLDFLGDRSIEKITLYSVEEYQYDYFTSIMNKFDLTTAVSFKGCLEGTSPTANKGCAVENLGKSLGLTQNEIMCFGDAGNDIQMLEYAGYSFAMGNATDDAKKAAKFIAKSNAKDGLAAAVCEYVLNM